MTNYEEQASEIVRPSEVLRGLGGEAVAGTNPELAAQLSVISVRRPDGSTGTVMTFSVEGGGAAVVDASRLRNQD